MLSFEVEKYMKYKIYCRSQKEKQSYLSTAYQSLRNGREKQKTGTPTE